MGAMDFGAYQFVEGAMMGQIPIKREPTFNELRLNWAIASIQRRLEAQGFEPKRLDGVFSHSTAVAVRRFQRHHNLRPFDEKMHFPELRVLYTPPVFKKAEQLEVVPKYMWGEVFQESGFDPAAVGTVNPNDQGLVQINKVSHPDITDEQAFNAEWAIDWGTRRLKIAYNQFDSKPEIAWHCAIANHNSPVKARKWFETGVPPLDEGEEAPGQIEKYVQNIMTHWDNYGKEVT